jgi:hypothetical protein
MYNWNDEKEIDELRKENFIYAQMVKHYEAMIKNYEIMNKNYEIILLKNKNGNN